MSKTLPNHSPKDFSSWKAIEEHQKNIASKNILSHFENEPNRIDYAGLQWEDFYVDISKNRLDKKGFDLLIELAKESELISAIEAQFSGAKINATENRAVLHTALRSLKKEAILVDGKEITLWIGSDGRFITSLSSFIFGTKYIGLLYGIVFLSHQVGSFLGAYLGGVFHDLYGSYDYAWYISIGLSIFAGLIHLPIIEKQSKRLQTA